MFKLLNRNTMPDLHDISLDQAIKMTTRYRELKKGIVNANFPNQQVLPLAETFSRAAFDGLLAQNGCAALRVYFSLDDQLQLRVIVVGVDDMDQDILPAASSAATLDGGGLVEQGRICPPYCVSSPLNP